MAAFKFRVREQVVILKKADYYGWRGKVDERWREEGINYYWVVAHHPTAPTFQAESRFREDELDTVKAG